MIQDYSRAWNFIFYALFPTSTIEAASLVKNSNVEVQVQLSVIKKQPIIQKKATIVLWHNTAVCTDRVDSRVRVHMCS